MTADPRQLPPGIRDDRSLAMLDLIERVASLDLSALLTTHFDTVSSDALIHLAWQYHVGGLEGYDLALDDAAKRDLISQAIELHRYKGTPWALKTALTGAGHAGATIDETVGRRRYDGAFRHNAEIRYSGGIGWALFRVVLNDIAEGVTLSAEEQGLLTSVVEEMKNTRSRLERISVAQPLRDDVEGPLDPPMSLGVINFPTANGDYFADGLLTANGIGEPLELVA